MLLEQLQGQNKELKEQVRKLESKQELVKEPAKAPKLYLFTYDICEQHKKSFLHLGKVNELGIDPHKENKICDWCINNSEKEHRLE